MGHITIGMVVQLVRKTYRIMLVNWAKGVVVVQAGIVVVEEEHWKVEFQKISSAWLYEKIVFWFRVRARVRVGVVTSDSDSERVYRDLSE